ncbi:MAG: thermonuclease family protein [Planctomycetaceae bacterium]
MTLLASVLVTGLLFAARQIIETRTAAGPAVVARDASSDNGSFADSGDRRDPSQRQTVDAWTDGSGRSTSEPTHVSPGFPQTRTFDGDVTVVRPPAAPATPDFPAPGTFKVVGVIDGDTVDVLVNNAPLRLRLNGIDTPETGQPFGNTAKAELSRLLGGKYVRYELIDRDRYDRSIADVYLDTLYVNKWLVQQGLAWQYVPYSTDPQLQAAEAEAKAAGRGLWSDPRRIAPWNWRKLSKVERDQYR